jgi:hypothetical protein
MAIGFTLGFLAVLVLTLAFLAIDRWVMMFSVAGAIFLLLFALYTLTPGTSAKPMRAMWTALLATGLWVAVSWAFEVYMRYFARYDALYGSIGAFMGCTPSASSSCSEPRCTVALCGRTRYNSSCELRTEKREWKVDRKAGVVCSHFLMPLKPLKRQRRLNPVRSASLWHGSERG